MFEAFHDQKMMILFGAAIALLVALRFVANFLKARSTSDSARSTVDNLNSRIRAWWKMCIVFLLCLLFGRVAALFVFGIISFLAMREYMTLVPTHRSDHLTLFWTFFVIMPLQYFMLGMHWFVAFVVVLPFFVFAFIPTSIAIEGDTLSFPRTRGKNPVWNHGLRLLPEPPAGTAVPAHAPS